MAVETVESPREPCTLPYPERFNAAVEYVERPPKGAKTLPDEARLILYALGQQATEGPCTQPKPWGWNIVENAKWQSWRQLGDLPKIEAMRLYVRALEDVEPNWWKRQQRASEEGQASSVESSAHKGSVSSKVPLWPPALANTAVPAQWVQVPVEGKSPTPRYDHAVARIATQVYVVGGSCGGRYLGDVWVLDIEKLAWRQAACSTAAAPAQGEKDADGSTGSSSAANGIAAAAAAAANGLVPAGPAFEPVAGHRLVTWGTTVLCIGGHTKAKHPKASLNVWALDTTNMTWSKLHITGEEAPVNRGGHTATVVGKRVYIFGGEDVMRRPLGDLWALDLEAMAWIKPDVKGTPPRERSAHIAADFRGRYVAVFGGGSLAHCFNDLHVLDTQAMEWTKPAVEGFVPAPRAGCAGALLTDRWFVMGGGDNTGGCTDVAVLDLKPLATGGALSWELVEKVEKASAIACEGMGVVPVTTAAALLAFGGYNGRYHNSLHLYQPAGAMPESEGSVGSPLKNLPITSPLGPIANGTAANPTPKSPTAAAAGGLAGAQSAPPGGMAVGPAKTSVSSPRAAKSAPGRADSARVAELEAALAQANEAATKAEAAQEAATSEVALMRRQLAAAQAASADAEKASAGVRQQLESEAQKCFKLEVEIAELRKQLARMAELERELERYRIQAKEAEENKGRGGLWGYISGSS